MNRAKTFLQVQPFSALLTGFLTLAVSPILVTPVTARAQAVTNTVTAEYVLQISPDFYLTNATKVLNQDLEYSSFAVPDFAAGSAPTVRFSGVHVQLASGEREITQSGTELQVQATQNSIEIDFDQVSVHEVITATINGVLANVSVDAACTGVVAMVQDPQSVVSATLSAVVNGNSIGMQVSNPKVQFSNPQLQMTYATCNGATNFSQILESTANTYLQDPTNLAALVQQAVNANLQSLTSQLQTDWTQPQQVFSLPVQTPSGTQTITGTLQPQHLVQTNTGSWSNTGLLKVQYPWSVTAQPTIQFQSSDVVANLQAGTITSLSLPEQAVTSLIQNYLTPGQWQDEGLANSISGFAHLLRSRILQFFVWNDLRHWPESTQFTYIGQTSAPVTATWLNGTQLSLAATAHINLLGAGNPYMHFDSKVTSKIGLQLKNAQLIITPSSTKISSTYGYDDPKHNGRVWISEIDSSAASSLNSTPITMAVPAVNLGTSLKVNASSISHDTTQKVFSIGF